MNRRASVRWTPADKAYALAGPARGLTDAEIGEHIGRTACAVSSWRRDNDTRPKRAKEPADTSAQPKPGGPKGFSPTQLLWATAYAGDRQADLILSMKLGKRIGQGYGPYLRAEGKG